jgi:hypothetical protein
VLKPLEIIDYQNQNVAQLNRKAQQGLMTMPSNTVVRYSNTVFQILIFSTQTTPVKKDVLRDSDITITQNAIFFSQFTFVNEEVVYGLDTFRKVWVSFDSMMNWQQTAIK